MDFQTQERSKRQSADFYAEICKANGLSSEALRRHAPDLEKLLFPDQAGKPKVGL
jgi:hypothetical protein